MYTMVVWKSTRNRQHARGTFSEASSPSSRPVTPAELQVREIASKIGLFDDSEILATVCHKMRKEYVVEEWQLPALDSRQWEKMQAPIGLAVAVQHISSHQLREQEIMELRLREEYNNNVQTYNNNLHNESLLEDEKEEDPIVSSSFHKDMAKSTSSSAGSSKQEEKEIVAKTASDANLDIVQVLALATSDDFSAIATDEDIYDEPNKTGKVVAVNENELDDEGNHPPPASDYLNESGEFSDDCSDCLKLSKVATAKDNNGTLEREEECNRGAEATTASPEIDHKDIDDQNGGINSTMVPVSSVKMAEVARTQANFEPVNGIKQNNPNSVENKMGATQVETEPADTLESENSIASLFVENKQEQAQVEIKPMNTTEREIFPTIEKIIETVQVITEPVNGMEQESSTLPSKIEREQEASQENSTKQEVSRVEIKPVERDSDSTATPKHLEQMETPLVENDNGDGRDSATTSMHVPKKPQEDFDIAKTGEIQETGSSDAESDVNTDIFSGISKNVSFSDDEDEPMLADKETTKLDCLLDTIESSTDDTAISSINKLETHRLLYAENYADDITVAISNVSPELLLLAAKRKKKMKKYRQKLDEGKYFRLLQYAHQRNQFELYPRLEMQQDAAMYLTVLSSVSYFWL